VLEKMAALFDVLISELALVVERDNMKVAASSFEAFREEASGSLAGITMRLEESSARLRACDEAMVEHGAQQRLSSSLAVDESFLVVKGISGPMMEKVKASGCSALGEPASSGGVSTSGRGEVDGEVVRWWQGRGRSDWNAVVRVCPPQRSAFLRAARALQSGGVVVAPYLTALGCTLRKERQGVFGELLQKGLAPRWRNGVEIEYMESGGWLMYDFGLT
jgi:hypothetical protein